MTRAEALDIFRTAGTRLLAGESLAVETIPLQQDGVVFRQMFEYPVVDFVGEVGFYSRVFGLPTIALTDDYALFTHPKNGYCLSFRKHDRAMLTGLKLLLMTSDIDSTGAHLDATGLVSDRAIRMGSPGQRVIHFSAPSGLAVEIWEDPGPGGPE